VRPESSCGAPRHCALMQPPMKSQQPPPVHRRESRQASPTAIGRHTHTHARTHALTHTTRDPLDGRAAHVPAGAEAVIASASYPCAEGGQHSVATGGGARRENARIHPQSPQMPHEQHCASDPMQSQQPLPMSSAPCPSTPLHAYRWSSGAANRAPAIRAPERGHEAACVGHCGRNVSELVQRSANDNSACTARVRLKRSHALRQLPACANLRSPARQRLPSSPTTCADTTGTHHTLSPVGVRAVSPATVPRTIPCLRACAPGPPPSFAAWSRTRPST
jgi:hypothetical protein